MTPRKIAEDICRYIGNEYPKAVDVIERALTDAHRRGREAGIEEAAREVENRWGDGMVTVEGVAAYIRALATPPAAPEIVKRKIDKVTDDVIDKAEAAGLFDKPSPSAAGVVNRCHGHVSAHCQLPYGHSGAHVRDDVTWRNYFDEDKPSPSAAGERVARLERVAEAARELRVDGDLDNQGYESDVALCRALDALDAVPGREGERG